MRATYPRVFVEAGIVSLAYPKPPKPVEVKKTESKEEFVPAKMSATLRGRLIKRLAAKLQKECKENSPSNTPKSKQSIYNYLLSISCQTKSDIEYFAFLSMYLLIKKYSQVTKKPLSFDNIHPLIYVAFCVASKLMEDVAFRNDSFALFAGLSLEKFNSLEQSFYKTLGFNLQFAMEPNAIRELQKQLLPEFDQKASAKWMEFFPVESSQIDTPTLPTIQPPTHPQRVLKK